MDYELPNISRSHGVVSQHRWNGVSLWLVGVLPEGNNLLRQAPERQSTPKIPAASEPSSPLMAFQLSTTSFYPLLLSVVVYKIIERQLCGNVSTRDAVRTHCFEYGELSSRNSRMTPNPSLQVLLETTPLTLCLFYSRASLLFRLHIEAYETCLMNCQLLWVLYRT